MIEVLELIKGVAKILQNEDDIDADEVVGRLVDAKNANRSLASKARMNICQFPLLTSTTVSFSAYNRVRNLLEQLYCNYLRIVIINNAEVLDLSKGGTRAGLIRNIHQNDNANYGLSSSSDYYSAASDIGLLDFLGVESSSFLNNLEIGNINKNLLIRENKKLSKPYYDNFNLNLLSEAKTEPKRNPMIMVDPRDAGNAYKGITASKNNINNRIANSNTYDDAISSITDDYVQINNGLRDKIVWFDTHSTSNDAWVDITSNGELGYFYRDPNNNDRIRTCRNSEEFVTKLKDLQIIDSTKEKTVTDRLNEINMQYGMSKTYESALDKLEERDSLEKAEAKEARDIRKKDLEISKLMYDAKVRQDIDPLQKRKLELEIEKKEKEMEKDLQNLNQRFVTAIKSDTRVQKNNDLEPSVLELTITATNGPNGSMMNVPISVAVKCVTHMIPATEFYYFIPDALITRSTLMRLIQWTTGEIKFMKDFVLDLDNTKFQATTDKKSVKWWRHLEARRNASKIRGFMGQTGFVPNATIVLSKDDVSIIKARSGIDLLNNTRHAAKLCDKFFLMHICIVDETDDTISLFNMDSKNWDNYTFGNLQNDLAAAMKNSRSITLR